MKLANNIYLLFTVSFLFLLPVQLIKAEVFYSTYAFEKYQPNNLAQSKTHSFDYELSEGQVKSRVEHSLINYLLGKTVDQYLDFGVDDETAKKSTKRIKLRLKRHRLMLLYRVNLNL